ncbi:hypothetical protein EDD18DRAFT_1109141 [Armillaria luteobubalina]|uniref:Uncharacterized protein n=1 Tax=Armillaria luteobubalina TaxID=153913 RepID=A0AA39PXG5_9AGAR|nr:hypothetical protein EDD18DRAFT_1109141 [Armillaria luteobubalina]
MESLPEALTQYERDLIFDGLDLNFNLIISKLLLQVSTLKKAGNSFLLAIVIVLWCKNGDNFFTIFFVLQAVSPWWTASQLVMSISSSLNMLIVDITIVWCCWVLWGHQWPIALVPGLCAIAGMIAKSMQIYSVLINMTNDIGNTGCFATQINWALIYLSLMLVMTLLCTLLIVYHIAHLASGVSSYEKIVDIVIESLAMYTLTLIVYPALVAKNLESSYYANMIMAYIKVISPMLLIGCVAGGSSSSSSIQVIINSTRDCSSILSRFMASKEETVIVHQDNESSITSSEYYRKAGMENV